MIESVTCRRYPTLTLSHVLHAQMRVESILVYVHDLNNNNKRVQTT